MNWLLLRGLTREKRHWGDFPQVFERLVPGAKVFTIDLPGVGTELLRDSPTNLRGIVHDVRSRWSELSAPKAPWGLLGFSLGGMVALDWAATYPEDFSRLVLMNTSAGDLSMPWDRIRPLMMPRLAGTGFIRESFARERWVLKMTTRLRTDIDRLAGEWAAIAGDPGRVKQAFVRQLVAATMFRSPPKVDMPLLVLTSAGDDFTNPSCSLKLAAKFEAPLKVHPAAGHDLALDDPSWAARETAAWLESVRSAAF